jgi:hypothetical protein
VSPPTAPAHDFGRRVHQASGMVSVQAACSVEVALALMADHAIASNLTIYDIADAVVERRIRITE